MAALETKSELGLAIICMSVIPTTPNKSNNIPQLTCPWAYSFLKKNYGSKLTVAEMENIDEWIEKNWEWDR